MTQARAFRIWLAALVVCVAAVLVCIGYVDRPVAEYMNASFKGTVLFALIMRMFEVLTALVAVLLAALIAAGVWRLTGHPVPSWARLPVLAAWAATFGMACETALKQVFGRSPASPLWLNHHVYTFHWFEGRADFLAFPSGTMTISGAVVAVAWLLAPRLRIPAALSLLIIGAGLVATNSHWLGDVVAGTFLGWTVGWMTVLLLDRPPA